MLLELDPEEAGILLAVLENDLSDLRMEIADTDSTDFRRALKKREELLRALVRRLETQ